VRPAALLNELIRGLWARAGGTLTTEQQGEYAALLDEWAAAKRAEADVVEAA
jgi:hypothetical protein